MDHLDLYLGIGDRTSSFPGTERDTSIPGRKVERKRVTMAEATGTMSTNGPTERNTGLQSDRLTEVRIPPRMAERKADGAARIRLCYVQASFRRSIARRRVATRTEPAILLQTGRNRDGRGPAGAGAGSVRCERAARELRVLVRHARSEGDIAVGCIVCGEKEVEANAVTWRGSY